MSVLAIFHWGGGEIILILLLLLILVGAKHLPEAGKKIGENPEEGFRLFLRAWAIATIIAAIIVCVCLALHFLLNPH